MRFSRAERPKSLHTLEDGGALLSTTATQSFVIALLLVAGLARALGAQDLPDWRAETLSGDWGGARTALYDRGFHIEAGYKADLARNAGGGLRQGTRFMGLCELRLRIDGERLAGWQGLTGYVHLLSSQGGRTNGANVGSFMGVDNIEVAANTVKLFHTWVEKSFWDNRASILAGLYPIDSEFYVTGSSAVFLHPSFGPAAELAASGRHGPAVFPNGALGARIKLRPDPRFYAQLAVTDGVPGHPENARGTHVRMDRGDGVMSIAEVGYLPFEAGHFGEPVSPDRGLPQPPQEKAHERLELTGKLALGSGGTSRGRTISPTSIP